MERRQYPRWLMERWQYPRGPWSAGSTLDGRCGDGSTLVVNGAMVVPSMADGATTLPFMVDVAMATPSMVQSFTVPWRTRAMILSEHAAADPHDGLHCDLHGHAVRPLPLLLSPSSHRCRSHRGHRSSEACERHRTLRRERFDGLFHNDFDKTSSEHSNFGYYTRSQRSQLAQLDVPRRFPTPQLLQDCQIDGIRKHDSQDGPRSHEARQDLIRAESENRDNVRSNLGTSQMPIPQNKNRNSGAEHLSLRLDLRSSPCVLDCVNLGKSSILAGLMRLNWHFSPRSCIELGSSRSVYDTLCSRWSLSVLDYVNLRSALSPADLRSIGLEPVRLLRNIVVGAQLRAPGKRSILAELHSTGSARLEPVLHV